MAMDLKTISRTELASNTQEIVNEVRQGYPALLQRHGEEQIVLLDALDFRLLRGIVEWVVTRSGNDLQEDSVSSRAIRDYLEEQISLGKAAELLRLSRFDLIERFERLQIPLHLGSSSLEEAQAEVEAARKVS